MPDRLRPGKAVAAATATARCVAAVVLLRDDGAALLQLRDDKPGINHPNTWVMPGGHREPDEGLVDAARRELFEETAYACESLRELTTFTDVTSGWPGFEVTAFWAMYDGLQPVDCREGQALTFVLRRDAAAYQVPRFLIDVWDLALDRARRQRLVR